MNILDNCFVGPGIKNPDKLIKKIHRHIKFHSFFVVVFENDKNRLEIISSKMFSKHYFKKQKYEIAAIVKEENEAFEYLRCLVDLAYKKYDSFDQKYCVNNIKCSEIDTLFFSENN